MDTDDLTRMKLINETDLEEQPDFEEMKEYYEHSRVRHQRTYETKQQFRRRMRKILKEARRNGMNTMADPRIIPIFELTLTRT